MSMRARFERARPFGRFIRNEGGSPLPSRTKETTTGTVLQIFRSPEGYEYVIALLWMSDLPFQSQPLSFSSRSFLSLPRDGGGNPL